MADDGERARRTFKTWHMLACAFLSWTVGLAMGLGSDPQADEEPVEAASREVVSQTTQMTDPEDDTEVAVTTTTTAKAVATTAPTTAPPTTSDPYAGETVSQANARSKAAEYLDFSAFSRSGLIEQLEYEGFSTADATYGVDSLNVDWMDQAAKKAADYMDYSSFSRQSLIQQLMYEGFTRAQAEHGADSVGL